VLNLSRPTWHTSGLGRRLGPSGPIVERGRDTFELESGCEPTNELGFVSLSPMPRPRQPEKSLPLSTAPQMPTCPRCGTAMRLVGVMPSATYLNVDQWTYVCYCGEHVDNLVRRPQ